ncbi:MAG: pyridoxine 5'-phosphate synthase [Candidatus Gastranaerophilales bacterium]|nr:pyridoxine 5'-phosphate synthase [Candidatus Gastranaerophilales bacterium]
MLLGVNIDHVATLRNARGAGEPSVLDAALICQETDVHGITVHLREDRRHIKDADVYTLKKVLTCNINLEMAATDEIQKIALDIMPQCCCLVPEKRQELTTEGGLDVAGQLDKMKKYVQPLVNAGILVSMFIDPTEEQVKASFDCGAPFIELHTGAYAEAFGSENEEKEFQKLKHAAEFAQNLGLKVNAGHGLNYENVYRMREIKGLNELNIGHSIISRAIFKGLKSAIIDMKNLIQ